MAEEKRKSLTTQEKPRASRRVGSVCQILVKMQEQLIFLLAALTAGISCLTALKSTATFCNEGLE